MIFRKKKARFSIPRNQLLSLKPCRSPDVKWVQYDSGEVVITVERKYKNPLFKLIAKILFLPKEKKIILDEIGSFTWMLLDGKHSVREIIRELSKKFKFTLREAEMSLLVFLSNLDKKGLIKVGEVSKRT